jgi:hypothetical protein
LQWRQIEHSRRHTGGDVAEIHADHALERAWSGFPRTIGNLARTAGNARPAIEEIYQLGRALEIDLPADSVSKTMATLEDIPPNSTTSMQRDLIRGRPSELDAQNGAVVRLAHEVEVATPVNQFFLYSLRSLELRARGALTFNRRSQHR